MSKAEFEEFIAKNKNLASSNNKNVEGELKYWRHSIENLYNIIENYMDSYIKSKQANIDYQDIELNEEFSGTYTVKRAIVKISDSTITFNPIGTMLIGSKGRVDVFGPRGKARLVLVKKNISSARDMIKVSIKSPNELSEPPKKSEQSQSEWVWKIASFPPEMRLDELTEDNFFDLLLSLIDA